MHTKNYKKLLYNLIIFIVILSILCYFVNMENFVEIKKNLIKNFYINISI